MLKFALYASEILLIYDFINLILIQEGGYSGRHQIKL